LVGQEFFMTLASPGSGPNLFSTLPPATNLRSRRETFLLSLFGQLLVVALIVYFTSSVIRAPAGNVAPIARLENFPLLFAGANGGGGGNFDRQPASRGTPPRASLRQFVPPDLIVPREMPKLPVEETIVAAPDIKFAAGAMGDPGSEFTGVPSGGPGGPGGLGTGCCDGIGASTGPFLGNGPPGIFPAGRHGVTVPEAIFHPEPSFSEEARKSRTQGTVTLLIVVGKDGRPYDVRVRQSIGMGLDEKAIEAVNRWRFRPATWNDQPVATEVEVEVNFHLY
jgi:periplasmic protein TonB